MVHLWESKRSGPAVHSSLDDLRRKKVQKANVGSSQLISVGPSGLRPSHGSVLVNCVKRSTYLTI